MRTARPPPEVRPTPPGACERGTGVGNESGSAGSGTTGNAMLGSDSDSDGMPSKADVTRRARSGVASATCATAVAMTLATAVADGPCGEIGCTEITGGVSGDDGSIGFTMSSAGRTIGVTVSITGCTTGFTVSMMGCTTGVTVLVTVSVTGATRLVTFATGAGSASVTCALADASDSGAGASSACARLPS